MGRQHQLGVFDADAMRYVPRGKDGRFIAVRLSPERQKILATAAEMRERMGLPPLAVLCPKGGNA